MLIDVRVFWPERAALFAAAMVAGGILSLWLILALGVGTLRDSGLNRAALGLLGEAEVGLVLPLWLGLRAVHTGIALFRRFRRLRLEQRAAPRNPSNNPKSGA